MKTIISRLTADSVENNRIFELGGEIIRAGGLVAFPTETVYGLGANALDANAAAKIYLAKGRPSDNPLIVHLSRVEDAEKYCFVPELYYKLAEAFMPGPITVIMDKREIIPEGVTGGLDTVAIRVPGSTYGRALISAAGVPIAAPSANLSGKPSPTTASHVIEDMDGRVDMIIDGGDCDIGLESTIVKLSGNEMILLRPGGISLEMLSAIGDVTVDKAVMGSLGEGERPLAPGMKYRHYAPDTKIVLLDGSDLEIYEYIKKQSQRVKVGVMLFEDEIPKYESLPITFLSLGNHSSSSEARSLFARLRETDKFGCDVFYIKVPDKSGIGLALYNRMLKAAGHEIIKLR